MNNIYLAYGSNMSLTQMKLRCPEATMLKITNLKGYRLVFKGLDNRSYATIVEDRESTIPVMLWSINSEDELSLDRYEDYPNFYEKKEIVLDNQWVMFYYMLPQFDYGIPSSEYFDTIKNAYLEFNLDPTNLMVALEESKQNIEDNLSNTSNK